MPKSLVRDTTLTSAFLVLIAVMSSCTSGTKGQQPPATAAQESRPIPGDGSELMTETITDGTEIRASQVFTKTWDLRNAGTVPWKDRYLVREGPGGGCTTEPKVRVPDADPGETVTITVQVTAPSNPTVCHVSWKMADAQGHHYFPQLTGIWFDVIVVR
ncbi:NBR1-Ig-like domain-containing protein [Nonomuraea salmonea]|uniref:NBR1-Ig-like domain-containing protein n=2 Tax=Nonomuraea salmonea TaxID=46181 RepID=A0ABV5NG23_9ACTN